MGALSLAGVLASFYAFQLIGCIASASAAGVVMMDGAPAPVQIVAGVDPNAIVAWVGAITGGLALIMTVAFKILQVVAPRTKTLFDDELRDALGEILDHVRSAAPPTTTVVLAPQPAAPPAEPAVHTATASPGTTSAITILAVLLLGGLQSGCATARSSGAAGVGAFLDCESPHVDAQMLADAKSVATSALEKWLSGAGAIDAAGLKADATPLKSDLLKCAMDGAIATLTAPAPKPLPGSAMSAPMAADAVQVRAAWASVRGELGWSPARAVQ